MIDICIAAYLNYDLLKLQLQHWESVEGHFNILICDNTPIDERQTGWLRWDHKAKIEVCRYSEEGGIDGTRHGQALDILVKKATSPIVGICDTDFFWLKPNILSEVEALFEQGCRCVGAELWYDDFWIVNERYPERAGWLAPCVFGMFVDRKLALSETFVVTPEEGAELKETGWRLRKKIIEDKLPCHVYHTFQHPKHHDPKICYFGTPENPTGVHLLKGSSDRLHESIEAYHAIMNT